MNQLTIEGKKLPFTLNILALKNFSKHLGYNKPSQIDERFKEMDYSDISFDDFDLLAAFVFYGLEEGHRMAKKAFKGYSVDEILLKMSENLSLIHISEPTRPY